MAATVAQPRINAKYALVDGEPVTIAKVHEVLYVIFEDRIEPFDVQMAPWTVLLGDCQMADDQALWDRIAGGPAAICTSRQMEVA